MTREEARREMFFAKREVMADSYIDKAYDMAIKALEEPERTGRWIPCSERLPDRPTGYLFYYFRDEYVLADEYIVMIEGASDPTCLYWTGKEWCDINEDEIYSVTAWMPLPEPYKGDTECQKS